MKYRTRGFIVAMLLVLTFALTQAFQTTPVTRHAFTLTMVYGSPQVQGATTTPVGTRRIVAVRADGSSATITLPTDESGQARFADLGDRSLLLRPEKQHVYLLDKLKLKSTTPMPGVTAIAPAIDPTCASGRPHLTFLRRELYQGYDTYVYSRISKTSDGEQETVTRWLAPALHCRDIQATMELLSTSGSVKTFRNYASSVVAGEPDPALFVIPQDYREVLPSEMETERAKALGRSGPPAGLSNSLSRKDEIYRNAQGK